MAMYLRPTWFIFSFFFSLFFTLRKQNDSRTITLLEPVPINPQYLKPDPTQRLATLGCDSGTGAGADGESALMTHHIGHRNIAV